MVSISRTVDSALSSVFICIMMAILDAYLMLFSLYYGFFIIGDVAVLAVWIAFIVRAMKTLKTPDQYEQQVIQTELWTAMVQWGFFMVLQMTKVALIYHNPEALGNLLGPNGLSLLLYFFLPVLFVMLVGIHHNVKPFCKRGANLRSEMSAATINIIDIVDIMTMLWTVEVQTGSIPLGMDIFLLTYTTIMLIFLPILAIHDLRYETPTSDTETVPYSIVYPMISFVFVDIANISFRITSWQRFEHEAIITLVLLAKNFVSIFQDIRYFVMYCGLMGPKKCFKCGVRYSECDLGQHQDVCKKSKDKYGGLSHYCEGKSTKSKQDRESKVCPCTDEPQRKTEDVSSSVHVNEAMSTL